MRKLLSIVGRDDWVRPFGGDLAKAGYEVTNVSTGAEARKALSSGSFRAALIEKGIVRGADAADLRKDLGPMPRVIVSRDGSYRGASAWCTKHPAAHLSLPLSGKELIDTLESVISRRDLEENCSALEHRTKWQKQLMSTLEEITRALTSNQDTETILDLIMEKAMAITRADAWSLLLIDEDTGDLIFERVKGGASKSLKEKRIPRGEGIVGWVAEQGKGIIVNNPKDDPRFFRRVDHITGFETRNLMCLPILSKGRVAGVLEVVNKQGGLGFTEQDLEIMGGFVDHAALSLELSELYQRMAEMAITDDLTNLFNMRYLSRTIEAEIERSNRYGTAVSLIFMDMDHFKTINDSHGHLIGSKLLVEVAQLLLGSLRAVDIVARYGGDEFVMVLPQTPSREAFMIAERIRASMEKHVFLKQETGGIRLTASLGVATYPDTAKTREELMRMADEAMYTAKNRSRNAVYEMTAGNH